MSAAERLVIGRIRGVHGLHGWVRVEPLTDRPEVRFAAGSRLFVEGSDRPLTVQEALRDRVGWRVRLAEVPDRTAAEGLGQAYLEATAEPGEKLGRGEYYWHEVIGANVAAVDGAALGKVVDIYRAGGAEVMVVVGPAGELDVPLVRAVVRVFEPRRGKIVVDAEAMGLRGRHEREDAAAEGAGGS
jgi:16S rRNA processing protein RimM